MSNLITGDKEMTDESLTKKEFLDYISYVENQINYHEQRFNLYNTIKIMGLLTIEVLNGNADDPSIRVFKKMIDDAMTTKEEN